MDNLTLEEGRRRIKHINNSYRNDISYIGINKSNTNSQTLDRIYIDFQISKGINVDNRITKIVKTIQQGTSFLKETAIIPVDNEVDKRVNELINKKVNYSPGKYL